MFSHVQAARTPFYFACKTLISNPDKGRNALALLLGGVKPKPVSEQAGHASVEFTLDHYAHVLPEEREGASDSLEILLFSGVVTS
jgi:hypothetical protein